MFQINIDFANGNTSGLSEKDVFSLQSHCFLAELSWLRNYFMQMLLLFCDNASAY